jgi:hypothetical protein
LSADVLRATLEGRGDGRAPLLFVGEEIRETASAVLDQKCGAFRLEQPKSLERSFASLVSAFNVPQHIGEVEGRFSPFHEVITTFGELYGFTSDGCRLTGMSRRCEGASQYAPR